MTDRSMPKPERAQPEPPAEKPEIGNDGRCDPRCDRFAACRPDSAGWVSKKEAAAHLKTTLSALKQRARRLGYVSSSHTAMPRSDQPKLCFDAQYFVLTTQRKKSK